MKLQVNKLLITVLCLTLASCHKKQEESLPYYSTPDFEAQWNPTDIKHLHVIPAFACTNQNNQTITDKDLEGKITLVNFIFTTCGGICPDMTKNLRTVQDSFSNVANIHFLSYSVKPWEDSVGRLKEFAAVYGMKSNWDLLTGNKPEIYALARKGYFAEEDAGYNKDSTEFLHTENVLLIDGQKHIRGLYKGTLPLDMQHIIHDIRILQKEEI